MAKTRNSITFLKYSDTFKRYRAGEVIFRENDPGLFMYVVKKGKVELRRESAVLETVEVGQIFGEMALIHGKRTATITSVSAVEFIRIDAASLEQLTEGCQLSFNRRFLFTLIERLSAGNHELLESPTARSAA